MSDILITLGCILSGWTKYAQKHKDDQLRARDETIAYLEMQLRKCREEHSHESVYHSRNFEEKEVSKKD